MNVIKWLLFASLIVSSIDADMQQWITVYNADLSSSIIDAMHSDIINEGGAIALISSNRKIYSWNLDTSNADVIIDKYQHHLKSIELEQTFIVKPVGSRAVRDNMVASYERSVNSQFEPPPNLDRIDQFELPLDHYYNWTYDGSGVNVYVLDSGVQIEKDDFEGRAVNSFTAYDSYDDCNGHGTHVAGIIGIYLK